jgi:hypothetical protein
MYWPPPLLTCWNGNAASVPPTFAYFQKSSL